MPTCYIPVTKEEPRAQLLTLSVNNFVQKDEVIRFVWIREMEMAMQSAMLHMEHQNVGLAISKLCGRSRECALTCYTSVDAPVLAFFDADKPYGVIYDASDHTIGSALG